jgi:hypothetical protein
MQGDTYFKSFRGTLNELIIGMFTGQNLPDFWMPAFNDNRAAGLIFMSEARMATVVVRSCALLCALVMLLLSVVVRAYVFVRSRLGGIWAASHFRIGLLGQYKKRLFKIVSSPDPRGK